MTSWDLGGDSNAFSFDNIGDHVAGTVLDLTERQQTDMDTGQPAFWDSGDPKMMSVVSLQTELRDPANPADDGKRTVSLAGSKKPESLSRMAAVIAAVKAATGGTNLQYGGTLTIQYVGDGQPTRRGFTAPKQYQAWYQPPAMELDQPSEHATAPPRPPAANPATAQTAPGAWPPPNQGQAPAWATGTPTAPPPAQAPTPPGAAAAPPTAPAGPPEAKPSPTSAANQPTPEQIAGLQALGIDPRSVYPNWTPPASGQ